MAALLDEMKGYVESRLGPWASLGLDASGFSKVSTVSTLDGSFLNLQAAEARVGHHRVQERWGAQPSNLAVYQKDAMIFCLFAYGWFDKNRHMTRSTSLILHSLAIKHGNETKHPAL